MRGLKLIRAFAMARKDKSHPSRMRGLKWSTEKQEQLGLLSHPSRMRGLKSTYFSTIFRMKMSHPSRMRGLKLTTLIFKNSSM